MDTPELTVTGGAVAVPAALSTPPRTAARRRRQRAVHGVLAVLAVAMAAVGAVLFDTDGAAWLFAGRWLVRELVPGVVTFAVVGFVVLRRRPAVAVGWSMLAVALAWGGSVLAAGLYYASFAAGWSSTIQFFVASHLLGGVGWGLAVTVLPQLFPTGWLSGWVWRVLLVATLLTVLTVALLSAAVDWESFFPEDPAPVELETARRLQIVAWYAANAVALASLAERVRRGPQLVRQQVGPFAVAWLVTVGGDEWQRSEYADASSSWAYLAVWLWPVTAAVVVGLTATQVGLWDTRLVVRRFAVYAVATGGLTALFVGVFFLTLLMVSSPPLDGRYRWLALLVAAAAVIAAEPLRRRISAALERRLLGERGQPLRPLARLDALTSATDAAESEVHQTIADTVAEALRSPGVELALHRPSITVVATVGLVPPDPLIVPLVHRGERLGELRIAPRTPGEPYGRRDGALLAQLAHQTSLLVYGLRRDAEIADLRSQAIDALVTQRSILGRDLHDGLAPLLAGAGLTADALRRGMTAGSPDAEEARRLATRLRTAASEVRRISHDLQPSGDRPRLAGAVADQVAAMSGPGGPRWTVSVDDGATAGLSPTDELGLVRVALEAITNVVRHARATTAAVVVRRLRGEIELEVRDDGAGIPQPYVAGLGIASMRGRVQALGGSFSLAPGPDGGTTMTARVPVPS